MRTCPQCNAKNTSKHVAGYCSQACRRQAETPEQRAQRIARVQADIREGRYDDQDASERAAGVMIDAIDKT